MIARFPKWFIGCSVFVLFVIAGIVFAPHPASAYYNPNEDRTHVPTWVYINPNFPGNPYNGRCTDSVGNNYSAGQSNWISTNVGYTDPYFRAQSISVPEGTTSVNLHAVLGGATCYAGGQPIDTANLIPNLSVDQGASISGFTPGIYKVGYPSIANSNVDIGVDAIPFTINLPAGLAPGTHTFNVTMTGVSRINWFGGSSYQCVKSGGNRGNYDNVLYFFGCAATDTPASFTITIVPIIHSGINSGAALASCSATSIIGWAFDGSVSSQSLTVHLYVDGIFNGPYPANLPRPDVNAFFGITGNHGFDIDIGSLLGARHHYSLYALGIDNNGNWDGDNPLIYDADVGPCSVPVCTGLTTSVSPGNPEPQQPFNILVNAKSTAAAPPGGTPFTIDVNIPGIYVAQLGSGTIAQGQTISSPPLITVITPKPIGAYPGTYTITFTSSGLTVTCPADIDIAAKPFFKANNGDISSGFSNGSTTCSNVSGWADDPGKLVSWYNLTNNHGAGTNLATIALGAIGGSSIPRIIDGVMSAQPPSGSPREGLSFSNDASTAPYGGAYPGTIDCPPDFYSKVDGVAPFGGVIFNSTTDVQAPGPLEIRGTFFGGLNSGNRQAWYVNGDAYISGNILVDPLGTPTTLSATSNFYLIAKGNIYIDPAVRQLNGVYIAQGNAAAGTGQIYTCAQKVGSSYAPPTADMLNQPSFNGCNQTLTVKGAFIADKINLYRSAGTLYNNTPAEVFNYTPSVWLAPPKSIGELFNPNISGANSNSYRAITSLPPVL